MNITQDTVLKKGLACSDIRSSERNADRRLALRRNSFIVNTIIFVIVHKRLAIELNIYLS